MLFQTCIMIYCSRSEELDRLLRREMDYFVFVVIYDYINEIPLHQFLLRGFLKSLSFPANKRSVYSLFLESIFTFPLTLHAVIPTSSPHYKQGLDVFCCPLR